jgi:hypothetical protein
VELAARECARRVGGGHSFIAGCGGDLGAAGSGWWMTWHVSCVDPAS